MLAESNVGAKTKGVIRVNNTQGCNSGGAEQISRREVPCSALCRSKCVFFSFETASGFGFF